MISWQNKSIPIGIRNTNDPANRPSQKFFPSGPNDRAREANRGDKGPNRGFRNLSYQELMERRAKGLCFKCGQNYSPMHQCPEKELKLVIWEQDEEGDAAAQPITEADEGGGEEWEMVCHVMESRKLQSPSWIRSRTMKIEGILEGLPILLLVDSGASHNYITKELVVFLGLSVTDTKEFAIILGDGSKNVSRGKCEGLLIAIGQNQIQINAFVLEIGGIDVILGMEWLETLGEVRTDWRRKIMIFQQGDKLITLKGYQAEEFKHALALQEIIHEEEEIKEEVSEVESQLDKSQTEELESLLQLYQGIFQELQGLPPKRDHEHAINLRTGAEPVNVRPYKYAYHHKDEIERQVRELLQAEVIR